LPATDTCGGTLTATASDGLPVGSVPCNYTITRTWTVSDACGNAAVPVTQVITVQNTTPPVIAAAPGPVTVQCASAVPVAGTLPVTEVITVQNTTPLVIAAAPGPVTVQCVSAGRASGLLPATDTCGGTLTATASDGLPVGSVPCNYTITRTWTVSDACGNAAV